VTLTDLWILMPLLIIAAGSLVILICGAFVPGRYGSGVGAIASLGAACWALQLPPATIAPVLGIAATPYARFFTIMFCVTAAAVLLLSQSFNQRRGITGEEYPATVLFAAFGMSVVAASVNLLTLFLGLEAMTFAFYILTAIDRDRSDSLEAGLKYLLMGATAAAFIAFGIAFIYAGSGSLAIAEAAPAQARMTGAPGLVLAGWGFLLIGVAFKASLVPAHLWTPDVYQGAPPPVTAFLSTGSKTAAFAALIMLLPPSGAGIAALARPILLLSLMSMIVGNLAALRQRNLRRMLAYSSIAHMGYAALALATGSIDGFAAVVFYLAAYTATNLAAFGAIAALGGGESPDDIEEFRGLGRSRPFRGGVLALALFSLAGIPLTAGFMAKFAVFAAVLGSGAVAAAVVGIVTAFISVYYYLRVVVVLYDGDAGNVRPAPPLSGNEAVALGAAAAAVIFLGVVPGPFLELITRLFPS
jgi:NADH-quinone oxidoreductase subunit N